MKSKLFLLALVAGMAACSTQDPYMGEEPTVEPRYVFDFTVQVEGEPSTKGVKTDWESGDVVYVFFQDNLTQYLRMTFNGQSWDCADKDGGTSFTGLQLKASGDKLSAIYMPPHVNVAHPTAYDTYFKFNLCKTGYYLMVEAEPYTVTGSETHFNDNHVKASLKMRAPEGFVQLFVADDAPEAYASWWLTERHFAPASLGQIIPGKQVELKCEEEGSTIPCLPATIDGETGYYFYGILNPSCRNKPTQYHFQMVQNASQQGRLFVASVKAKDPVTATMYTVNEGVVSNAAFKLTGWKDTHFVDLGFGSVKWAIGDLTEGSPYISGPTTPGDYYVWGSQKRYSEYNGTVTGNYVKESMDPAYHKNTAWRLPTQSEFTELVNNMNWSWVTLEDNSQKGVCHATSKSNGLSLVFLTSGWKWDGKLLADGDIGNFWSSSPSPGGTANQANCLIVTGPGSGVGTTVVPWGDCLRNMGMFVRPVMDR